MHLQLFFEKICWYCFNLKIDFTLNNDKKKKTANNTACRGPILLYEPA